MTATRKRETAETLGRRAAREAFGAADGSHRSRLAARAAAIMADPSALRSSEWIERFAYAYQTEGAALDRADAMHGSDGAL